jgi:hypothetical protein
LYYKIRKTVVYAKANAERFAMDKTTRLGDWFILVFLVGYDKYEAGALLYIDETTRTPLVISELKVLEKMIIPLYRELNNMLRGNPLVKAGDLDAMGLPPLPSGERHESPIADKAPEFYATPLEGHRVRIFFRAEGSERKSGRPPGQHGAEIKTGLSEEVITDPELLPHSLFDTASPYTLTLSPNDAGKTLNIALRWENMRGLKGPWSAIVRIVVP